eukprot:944292-Rhodomonas_salina.1
MGGSVLSYGSPTRCPELTKRTVLRISCTMSGTHEGVLPYGSRTRCPVLTSGMLLQARFAISFSDLHTTGYFPNSRRYKPAVPQPRVQYNNAVPLPSTSNTTAPCVVKRSSTTAFPVVHTSSTTALSWYSPSVPQPYHSPFLVQTISTTAMYRATRSEFRVCVWQYRHVPTALRPVQIHGPAARAQTRCAAPRNRFGPDPEFFRRDHTPYTLHPTLQARKSRTKTLNPRF